MTIASETKFLIQRNFVEFVSFSFGRHFEKFSRPLFYIIFPEYLTLIWLAVFMQFVIFVNICLNIAKKCIALYVNDQHFLKKRQSLNIFNNRHCFYRQLWKKTHIIFVFDSRNLLIYSVLSQRIMNNKIYEYYSCRKQISNVFCLKKHKMKIGGCQPAVLVVDVMINNALIIIW